VKRGGGRGVLPKGTEIFVIEGKGKRFILAKEKKKPSTVGEKKEGVESQGKMHLAVQGGDPKKKGEFRRWGELMRRNFHQQKEGCGEKKTTNERKMRYMNKERPF